MMSQMLVPMCNFARCMLTWGCLDHLVYLDHHTRERIGYLMQGAPRLVAAAYMALIMQALMCLA